MKTTSQYKVYEVNSNNPTIRISALSDALAKEEAMRLAKQYDLECNKDGEILIYKERPADGTWSNIKDKN